MTRVDLRVRLLTAFTLTSVLGAGCDGDDRLVSATERSFDIGDRSNLVIDDGAGDIEVIGEVDRNDITIVAELRTGRVSRRSDAEARDSLRVGFEALDETLGQAIATLSDPPRGYYVDMIVLVPASIALTLHDDSGDIRVRGVEALELNDGSGDVLIEAIEADVRIHDESGDTVVDGVGGDLWIEDRSGDIVASDVAGDAQIEDRSGDTILRNVEGRVTIDDLSGDIVAIDCGEVDVRSDTSGDVVVR